MQRNFETQILLLLACFTLVGCMNSGSDSVDANYGLLRKPSSTSSPSATFPPGSPQPTPVASAQPSPSPEIVDGGGGGSGQDRSTPGVYGKVTFDLVPVTADAGLDYSRVTQLPVRGAVVELISGTTVVASGITADDGTYSIDAPQGAEVVVRVKAQLLKMGTPSWDFQVVDNTRSKALYALQSSSITVGATGTEKNLNAASGWNGSKYASDRSAAPFAILEVVRKSLDRVLTADSALRFPALKINWSPKNVPTSGTKTKGEIGTSHFDPDENQLYILGADGTDTDEYDSNVIAHEWGHYFEHNFSRSDSIGGSHTLSSRLDPRVAFSEGFGNAFSAMATGSTTYADSSGAGNSSTQITFDVEAGPAAGTRRGWFNESSVQSLLYDLYDEPASDDDAIQGGFKSIYEVLTKDVKTSYAFSTIHTFAVGFRNRYPQWVTQLSVLLQFYGINDTLTDPLDSYRVEANDGGTQFALPIYTKLNRGVKTRICTTGKNGSFNKLGVRRFFYFRLDAAASAKITIAPVQSSGDPGILLYNKGVKVAAADSYETGKSESVRASLEAGYYTGEIYDYRQMAEGRQSEECFNVTLE